MRYAAGSASSPGSREGLRYHDVAAAHSFTAACRRRFGAGPLRALLPGVLAPLLVLVPPRAASACSCIAEIPLCQSFWQADAVFAGEVLSFESVKPDQPFSRRVARIRVDRAWRGNVDGIVEVKTGAGGGDCGYSFRRGTKYVVYAYRTNDGSLTTGICSPTKPLDKAAADLEYFEDAESPSPGGRVFGSVQFESKGGALAPAKGVAVTLAGNSQSRTVLTDDDGAFEFVDVPAGRYEVRVEGAALPPWKAEIRSARACAVVNMWIPRPARTP